ncbi:DNA-directed DNA/RNA polymerase mu isoform X2 [Hypomesus transpacificus]|uniref:DNA-directed DNA/RNA polymerase mu isoform X2 n=1 Tax=Hypomesus transpacificus TaxID=137520 RepID=UPI001F07B1EA|nr:DNA-directed DNA/RNA polymerase mu isoform X2 [Hypomesus transpacificus]
MVPFKKRRIQLHAANSGDGTIKFPQVVIFLLERKMGASRKSFLTQLGRGKGFLVEESFNQSVTHVVSENNSGDEARTWLNSQLSEQSGVEKNSAKEEIHVLDISWYTESMRVGCPVVIMDRHRLQETQQCGPELTEFSVPSYACQRCTPLMGHNSRLTDALSILADSAEFSENEGRNVAFRRAAAVLKSLPQPVTRLKQLQGLPCLGEHSLRVIKEILVEGVSLEVETTKHSKQYTVMKILTGIFGVGVKTADRWFREGIHTLSELRKSGHALNRAQQAGLQHYEDLNLPVTKTEADIIGHIVKKAVNAVLEGAEITLIGGFRRGKQTGHDVDFLITHPEEGREEGLMPKVVSWLESQGYLLYQKTTRNSYLEAKEGPGQPSSNMDRFERCFLIFRLPVDMDEGKVQMERLIGLQTQTENCTQTNRCPPVDGETETHTHPIVDASTQKRIPVLEPTQGSRNQPWRAVRVDLVVSPHSQFAFALLGWTGSKLFERDLRRWAKQEKAMSLSSHALYNSIQRTYLRANSEEEIFAHLGLEYIPPSERNA